MSEIISLLITGGIALFITIVGVYITSHGGDWEDFWKGRLKQVKEDNEARDRMLDNRTRELLAEYDAKRKRGRFIWFYCVGGILGFSTSKKF